ncbi:MAG: hypothetical protein WCE49_13100, partial [Terrimicrobiaceae bacterium]
MAAEEERDLLYCPRAIDCSGSTLALVLLAVGASLHAWRIEGWRRFLLSVAVCATVVAVGSV